MMRMGYHQKGPEPHIILGHYRCQHLSPLSSPQRPPSAMLFRRMHRPAREGTERAAHYHSREDQNVWYSSRENRMEHSTLSVKPTQNLFLCVILSSYSIRW